MARHVYSLLLVVIFRTSIDICGSETFLLSGTYLIQMLTKTVVFQTCEIKAEGGKRFLTLHKVKLDQAGEVLYQALNAFTTAILTVKGMAFRTHGVDLTSFHSPVRSGNLTLNI